MGPADLTVSRELPLPAERGAGLLAGGLGPLLAACSNPAGPPPHHRPTFISRCRGLNHPRDLADLSRTTSLSRPPDRAGSRAPTLKLYTWFAYINPQS